MLDFDALPQWTVKNWPTELLPNFKLSELACSETGECRMAMSTLRRLQALRYALGKPVLITSGYRSSEHTVEKKKSQPGTHTYGRAVDVGCSGEQAYELLAAALATGWTGVGIAQRGAARFVHLDDVVKDEHIFYRPAVWSY